jgi:hypothetical protein
MIPFICAVLLGGQAPALQGQPHWQWNYPGHQHAYPANPEALVQSWYRRYLGRSVDPSGYETWVNSLYQGTPPEAVLATILASEEYYERAGATPEGFVQRLFLDLSGRRPSRGEFDHWVRRTYYGDRMDIAYALVTRYPQSWNDAPPAYDYRRPFSRYGRD